jgi:cytochrome c-type biogenesis protein CcmF
VHAFAESDIGIFFVAFMVLMGGASVILIFSRWQYLRSDNHLDSVASRESGFLFNNLVFLAACFAVIWGTMFPVISEAIQGEKITVGPPFFNKIFVPVGLFILFLTGVGPLLAWRKTSFKSLRKNFFWPLLISLVVPIALLVSGVRHVAAHVSFYLCAFVTLTIVIEYFRGTRARMRAHGENLLEAIYRLMAKNKRRYGGYVVHFGIVLLFIGMTGTVFNIEVQDEVLAGDTITIGGYEVLCESVEQFETPNYVYVTTALNVSKNGKHITTLHPEKRHYHASEQSTSEVAMRSNLKEDLYMVLAGVSENEDRAVVQLFLNPLVAWVWIGGIVMAAGTVIAILPDVRETRINRQKKDLTKILETSGSV